MKIIIKKIGYDYDIDIVELEKPEDHIHMVVRNEPKMSPSQIMQVDKKYFSQRVFQIIPRYQKTLFLGR